MGYIAGIFLLFIIHFNKRNSYVATNNFFTVKVKHPKLFAQIIIGKNIVRRE